MPKISEGVNSYCNINRHLLYIRTMENKNTLFFFIQEDLDNL